MSAALPKSPPNAATRLLLFLAFCILAGTYYTWTASPILAGFGGDNAVYLLTGTHYSPFSPHSQVAEYFARRTQYPPLFPLALALAGGGESLLLAHILTTTFLVLAFVALFWWLCAEGFGTVHAFTCALAFALLPGTYMQALLVHSENAYLFFSIASLACAAFAERRRDYRWLWGTASLAAAASLTRGAGIALVAGVLCYLLVKRVPGRLWLSLAVTAPMVGWWLLGPAGHSGYFEAFIDLYGAEDFTGVAAMLQTQAYALYNGWLSNFSEREASTAVAIALGIVCLTGTVFRVFRAKLDGYYVLMYLGLIFVWPYPAEATRLMFVAVPVLLVHALCIARAVPVRFGARTLPVVPAVLLAVVAVQALPDLALTSARHLESPPPELEAYRRHPAWYTLNREKAIAQLRIYDSVKLALERAAVVVPEDECIYAVKPSITAFYSGRISVKPPAEELDEAAFREALAANQCRYFFFLAATTPSYAQAMYPFERVAGEITVLDIVPFDGNDVPGPTLAILAKREE